MDVLFEVSGERAAEAAREDWIFDRIRDWSSRTPQRFAFAMDRPDGSAEEYTYGDVLRLAERVAAGLASCGVACLDRVGILMENTPQWVFALLGSMRIGATTVPLSTLLPDGALANLALHAGCKIIFTDILNVAKARRAAAVARSLVVVIGEVSPSEGCVTWPSLTDLPGTVPAFPRGHGGEPALIVYTSGTTGDPKGVQLSLENLIHEIRGAIEALKFSPDHRILSALPFSHVLPLVANALGPLSAGAGVVFLPSVSAEGISEAFHKHRITCFVCVPQFFYLLHRRIFDAVRAQSFAARTAFRLAFRMARRSGSRSWRQRLFRDARRKLGADLWLFVSGGARLDPGVAEDLTVLGYTVVQAYGLTETTAAATITPVDAADPATVGRPIRGVDIRIDRPADDGIGEVWIRGPIVMTGYYRSAEQSREVMEGAWFRSGDLGYIRRDGNLVITGRIKDVIVLANGKNVYPEELERHYEQSPYIKEVCIMGLPTESGPSGETLHAVVVPDLEEFRRRGHAAIAHTVRFDLETFSRALPGYQHILSMSICAEPLPRTTTRKLRRIEVQSAELGRREAARASALPTRSARPAGPAGPLQREPDDGLLGDGIGAIVAKLARHAKPGIGRLDASMSLELDLGFDSLERIELFAAAEAELGVRMDEPAAGAVMTLGDLARALERARDAPGRWRSWREILGATAVAEAEGHWVFQRGRLSRLAGLVLIRVAGYVASLAFPVRFSGQENIPAAGPFLICPNHQSFLEGPLIVAQLPRAAIDKIVILGYSDYWQSTLMRAIARFLSVVSIDSNINLVRAMQVGAAGLRRGCAVVMFPEGSRSIDGRVAEFKKGAAILACALGVPIVPVGVRGAFESWPRGGTFKLHPIEIAFGVPIHPGEFGAADPETAMTAALQRRVRELAGQT